MAASWTFLTSDARVLLCIDRASLVRMLQLVTHKNRSLIPEIYC